MGLHARRLAAMERLVTNPSPAITAYLRNYRRNLAKIESDDDTAFMTALASGAVLWGALTDDEKVLLNTINQEN